MFFLVNRTVNDDCRYTSEQDADADRNECKTDLVWFERVRWVHENERESCEEEEENGEGEACVERKEEHDWLGGVSWTL